MRVKTFSLILVMAIGLTLIGAPPPEDITVAAGTTYNNDITASSSDIIILNGAEVKGDLETTTGDIYLEENARADKITTVSGNIYLDKGSQADKDIDTESGTVRVREGARLKGNVTTETGDIRSNGATFDKDIRTRHGYISLKAGTYVDGDVSILNRGHGSNLSVVEIYLGEGVYVNGKVTASHVDDNVNLDMYKAEVDGKIDKVTMVGDDDDDEDEVDDDCGGRPEWNSSVSYNKNDEVRYEGNAYKASKKAKGYEPSSSNRKNLWQYLGSCD